MGNEVWRRKLGKEVGGNGGDDMGRDAVAGKWKFVLTDIVVGEE
jgi:hypothetical protein